MGRVKGGRRGEGKSGGRVAGLGNGQGEGRVSGRLRRGGGGGL